MTFERPWILILCLLPVVWTLWQWRMESRRAALALKAAALLAVLLALAQPSLTVYSSRVALAILVDTSASVSPADLEQASEKASRVERARGSNWSRVMPFARAVRKPAPEEGGKSW
ncbi:MAG: hypothetical protein FJW37_05795, partial [Acidobacteria bacterium]|nr:hypothetical protein [Acidobacteriota bacterium]